MITVFEQKSTELVQRLELIGSTLRVLTISSATRTFGKPRDIDLSKLNRDAEYQLCCDRFGYTSLVYHSFGSESNEKALILYIPKGDDGFTNMLIHTYTSVDIVSPDVMNKQIVPPEYSFKLYDEIVKRYPDYASKVHAELIHHMLEENISTSLSLSCMDAQLELITKMLMVIVDRDPALGEALKLAIPNLDEIKKSLNDTSLLNIKNTDKLLKEINHKKYIRDVQVSYYKIKSSLFGALSVGEDEYPSSGVDVNYEYDPNVTIPRSEESK